MQNVADLKQIAKGGCMNATTSNTNDIRNSFIGFGVACFAIAMTLAILNSQPFEKVETVSYEQPSHIFLDTINDREFNYDAEWVQLGYSSVMEYHEDLENAKSNSKGVTDDAIETYSQVITDEQIEQLKQHEVGMTTAVNFSTYRAHSDSFDEIILACADLMQKQAVYFTTASSGSSAMPNVNYISNGSGLTKSGGVYYYNGRRETWYSQRESGQHITASNIPGRNVGSDGIIRDSNGYICVAASDLPLGSTVETSLGIGKVYDTGCANGTTDIYTDW